MLGPLIVYYFSLILLLRLSGVYFEILGKANLCI